MIVKPLKHGTKNINLVKIMISTFNQMNIIVAVLIKQIKSVVGV